MVVGFGRPSPKTPVERLRLEWFSREIVKRNNTALRGAGDLAQGIFHSLAIQVNDHTLQKEERRFAGVEPSLHEPREPVFFLEIGSYERDAV